MVEVVNNRSSTKQILLVGNGFDLAYDKLTRYQHFLFFVFSVVIIRNKMELYGSSLGIATVLNKLKSIKEFPIDCLNNTKEPKKDNIKDDEFKGLVELVHKFFSQYSDRDINNENNNKENNNEQILFEDSIWKLVTNPFFISFLHFSKFNDSVIFSVTNCFKELSDTKELDKILAVCQKDSNSEIFLYKNSVEIPKKFNVENCDYRYNYKLNIDSLNTLFTKISGDNELICSLSYLYTKINNDDSCSRYSNWCDIENYISLLVTGDETIIKSFGASVDQLVEDIPLNKQSAQVVSTYLEGLNLFSLCFAYYLRLLDIDGHSCDKSKFKKEFFKGSLCDFQYYHDYWEFSKVISFNYTDTFEPLLKRRDENNVQYIHGSIKESNFDKIKIDIEENKHSNTLNLNVIFGYTPSSNSRANNNCLEFEKLYQKISKRIRNKYNVKDA